MHRRRRLEPRPCKPVFRLRPPLPYTMYVEAEEGEGEGQEGVLHSPYSPVQAPEATSLSQLVTDRAGQHGDKVALIDASTQREMTYLELVTSVRHVRCGLYKQGVLKGDVVLLLLPNCMEYPVIFHAIISLGGVVTACSPLTPPEEVCEQIKASRARHVFTTPDLIPVIRDATPVDYPMKKAFVIGASEGCVSYSSLIQDDASEYPVVFFNVRRDLCLLPYSSGTVGCTRPVTLTHHNMVSQLCQLMHPDVKFLSKSDVLVNVLSMSHPFVIIVYLNVALITGCTTVLVQPRQTDFFIKTVLRYKPTVLHLIPPIIDGLLQVPEARSVLSSVRTVTNTAAGLCPQAEGRLRGLLPQGASVRQMYGMMECCNVTIAPVSNTMAGTVGQLLPNISCKVVDLEDGHLCGPGECGEMWVRGPQVSPGYLDPESDTLPLRDHQNWFQTGDIFRYDSGGNLYFVDCVKDIIKYGGLQVPPSELEAVLRRHPGVQEAVVVGVPDEVVGELPKAFVVRTTGHRVNERELVDFVEVHVAPQKRLRGGVEFISHIPKLGANKINRHEFRQLERNRQKRRTEEVRMRQEAPLQGLTLGGSAIGLRHRETDCLNNDIGISPAVKRQRTDT